MNTLRLLRHLRVLTLEPGDVLVYKAGHRVAAAEYEQITEAFDGLFPDNRVLVIEGADLGVLRQQTVAAA